MKIATRKKGLKTVNKKKKLLTYYAIDYNREYHPLKNRKIKTDKIKTILDAPMWIKNQRAGILSKKYSVRINEEKFPFIDITTNNEVMFDWLKEIGISVKQIDQKTYLMKDIRCSLSYVLLQVNKMREEKHLKPFFINFLADDA